ncbi:MAG: protein TolQ [Rhodospirillales bacterium]|nr:protein TolQ [Rhodospirillales bacterium]
MENQAVDAMTLAGSTGALDFGMLALFERADLIVKSVIILLLLASLWCWAIIFEKWIGVRRLNKRSNAFEKTFWSGQSLDDLYDRISAEPRDPMSSVFVAAMREWRRSPSKSGIGGATVSLAERIDRVMHITVQREMDRVERYMTFLATTGSTAPFIGLFGTVWGIMNSFQSIALSKNTSLAVVAPGIAEALFATALGLLAAIPAVVAYNKLSRDLDRYAGRLDNFAVEFGAILSREMEDEA